MITRKRLGEILLAAGVIDETKLQAALQEQKRWGGPLGRVLIDMNAISEEVLVVALSRQLNFPSVDIDKVTVPDDVLGLVSGNDAQRLGVMPLKLDGKFLDVAMTNPTDIDTIDELRINTKLNVRPYIAGPKAIERAHGRCYGLGVSKISQDSADDLNFPGGMRVLDMELGTASQVSASPPPRPQATPRPQVASPPQATPRPRKSKASSNGLGSVDIDLSDADSGEFTELAALETRISSLEALVVRDEQVIKKLMGLLVEKGVATKEEILKRIS